jgi:hypothetical protein
LNLATKGELDKLQQNLELLKQIQQRDIRKQYIHENVTQKESNEYLQQLRDTVTAREKEIRALEKQIEENKTS